VQGSIIWLLAEREELRAVRLAFVIADVVDLEGGMGDTVLVFQQFFEVAAAGVAVLALAYEDVGGEGWEARCDGPDVEVVDLDHAL